ncbi:MAG: hypothetical protein K0S47_2395 [Herbinix sp.]|jgi:dTDP-4-dehydrorhamnose reductase|nr:hypothetical protein [Herbinix sp.]
MMRILITGANGQLGRALQLLLKENNKYEVIYTDTAASEDGAICSLDITNEEMVNSFLLKIKPDIIINCAAFTAVDLCETEQDLAYRVNALGPKNLAMAAEQLKAKLVHISTDYVFDGQADHPYVESDPTNPVSVYGKTKLAGDNFVLENCNRSFILRTAWVYGDGKNFVKTMLRLAGTGNTVRVVEDQFGTPTSALELARVILFLMETESYGIYHATNEGITNWYEFAKTIFEECDKKVDLQAIPTSEYPTPAKRPMYSVLDNKELRERHGYIMKDWKDALQEYLKTI